MPRRVSILLFALSLSACSEPPEFVHCAAGAEIPCFCEDGTQSIRICGTDGILGICQCPETGAEGSAGADADAGEDTPAGDLDATTPDASSDTIGPDDTVDSDAPDDTVDSDAPDAPDDTVDSDTPDDTVDTVDTVEPDATSDTVEPDTPGDTIEPDTPPDAGPDPEPTCDAPGDDPYLGCEFWTVDLPVYDDPTSTGPELPHGVSISNPGSALVAVQFESFDVGIAAPDPLTVAPGGTATAAFPRADLSSSGLSSRSFRVTSSGPIRALQINPLDLTEAASADATLLLPARSLGDRYRAATMRAGSEIPFSGFSPQRAFVTVIATADGTTNVAITPTADVDPDDASSAPEFASWTAGSTRVFELNQGQVLNLSFTTRPPAISNPTGTLVQSDRPVSVFAGHEQATAGSNSDGDVACCADHLEAQMPPTTRWGSTYVAAHSPPRGSVIDHWIVVADQPGTRLTTTPTIAGLAGISLDAGEFAEVETASSFVLDATQPVLLARVLAGSAAAGGVVDLGDPSLTVMTPVIHFGTKLVAMVPAGLAQTWISMVTSDTAVVTIDGSPVTGSVSTLGAWRLRNIAVSPGAYLIESSGPAAATVVGFGDVLSFELSASVAP